MPKELEEKLKKEAATKGFGGKKSDAYVYGTMRKTGWVPSTQKKAKKAKKKSSKSKYVEMVKKGIALGGKK